MSAYARSGSSSIIRPVLVAIVLATFGIGSAQAEEMTAAVMDLALAPTLEPDRAAIEAATRQGLVNAGWRLTSQYDTNRALSGAPQLDGCGFPSCLAAVAKVLGVRYIVDGDVTSSPKAYSIALRFWDAVRSRVIAEQRIECRAQDPCPPVADNMVDVARELGRLGRKAIAPAELSSERSAEPSTSVAAPAARSRVDERPWWATPWVPIAVGGVVASVGLVLLGTDGLEVDCRETPAGKRCLKVLDNRTRGVALVATGGALTASGLVWLALRGEPDDRLAIGVGPGTLSLRGSF
jgi:hypothetical protein